MADEKGYQEPTPTIGGMRFDEAVLQRKRLNATAWADLSTADKLDRLREVVKELQRTSEWHGQRIQDVASHLSALDEHGHLDGKVVIPVVGSHRHGPMGGEAQEKKVEGWF